METKVDDELYDRVLYAYGPQGHQVMQEILKQRVLLIGVRGLGVEIAKNLILNGVSIGVHDNAPVQISDLGAQVRLFWPVSRCCVSPSDSVPIAEENSCCSH